MCKVEERKNTGCNTLGPLSQTARYGSAFLEVSKQFGRLEPKQRIFGSDFA
jgi:hypothetical protein